MHNLMGIDGGGTKTLGLLATKEGRIIKKKTAGPGNYHAVGREMVEANLKEVIHGLLDKNFDSLGWCYLGLSGVGRPSDHEVIDPILGRIGIKKNFTLTNDAAIALMGGALSNVGILIIAGTGSIIYGMDERGNVRRAGGYGQYLADEGSGYRLGLKGLISMMKGYDGRGQKPSYNDRVLQMLSVESPMQLVPWISGLKSIKEEVGKVAPVVLEASQAGDPIAKRIVDEEISDLLEGVRAVRGGLELQTDTVQIILTGGVFEHSEYYFNLMRDAIRAGGSGAEAIRPKSSAGVGAIIGAAAKSGIALSKDFLNNLTTSWEEFKE
jgi:N-acetylglucosamine kinase-like BadF-type ATPase